MLLVVWITDKPIAPSDQGTLVDTSNYKAGDVIDILPDGWAFSQAEMNNPSWRIIGSPILGVHREALLSAPDYNRIPLATKRMRNWMLNLSQLPEVTGSSVGQVVSLPSTRLAAASVQKP